MTFGITERVNVVWFKRDLRIMDHAPLWDAAQTGPVIPLYILEPEYWALPDTSYRQWSFIHDCLVDLNQGLEQLGSALIFRHGNVIKIMENLRAQFANFTLWSHEETGNDWTFKRDLMLKKWCQSHAIEWIELPSHGVVRRLKSRDTWSKIRNQRMSESTIQAPQYLRKTSSFISSDRLSPDLVYRNDDPISSPQKGGRSEGVKILKSFINDRSRNYLKTLSKPGISARHSSRLSTHIAYGTLSVREIEHQVKDSIDGLRQKNSSEAQNLIRNLEGFLSRLAWRCHFVQKLEQQPDIEIRCMHSAFEGMRDLYFKAEYLEAWKTGKTGYPLIDACMRSLIANGWINFRMRAMLVSFASYHLLLDWRNTAPYLARLFTDYEPGIHYSQMQMQSGITGINAVRIYNPIKQSIEHDPEGRFIRRYVPELSMISNQWIHEPWRIPEPLAQYPQPIVEHETAVRKARGLLAECWRSEGFRDRAAAINQKLGSRNRPAERHKVKKSAPQLAFDFGETS